MNLAAVDCMAEPTYNFAWIRQGDSSNKSEREKKFEKKTWANDRFTRTYAPGLLCRNKILLRNTIDKLRNSVILTTLLWRTVKILKVWRNG